MRRPQVRKLASAEELQRYLHDIGVQVPFDATVDPHGVLSTPLEIRDAAAGTRTAPNRFVVLPMEGWDGTTDGQPTDLVRRRWQRFGSGGCGLVWGEATAVRPDGRANPRQLMLTDRSVSDFAALRELLAPNQLAGLQLTHSGRFSRPDGTPAPRTAYEHPFLDGRVGAAATDVLSDGELDELAADFIDAAERAHQAGFDFVDIKHCHGYLLHELLSARDRPGRYGGDIEGRTRFMRTVVEGIRQRVPHLLVAVRLSVFDVAPYRRGDDGGAVSEARGNYRYAFGGDGTGTGTDLTESQEVLATIEELGIGLVSTTAGSPYYSPHIQRPAYFPPSDGYEPPEDPLAGVARQLAATSAVKEAHPGLTIVGSGYSYLQQWLPNVAQAVVASGGADAIGLGRMSLPYPTLAADVLAGRALEERQICRTFSDCTTAPRHGLISGCFPLDPFYKSHPQRTELARAKKEAKR